MWAEWEERFRALAEQSRKAPILLRMCPACRARCVRLVTESQIILSVYRVPGRYGGMLQCMCCAKKMRDPMMSEGMRKRKRIWRGVPWPDPRLPADRMAVELMDRFSHLPPLVELCREVIEGWGVRAQLYWNRMNQGKVKTPLWNRMERALEDPEERARLMRLAMSIREMEQYLARSAMQNPDLPLTPVDWRRAAMWLAERKGGYAQVARQVRRALDAHGVVLDRRRQRAWQLLLIGALALREGGFEGEGAFWEWAIEAIRNAPLLDQEDHPVDRAFEVWRRAGLDVLRESSS